MCKPEILPTYILGAILPLTIIKKLNFRCFEMDYGPILSLGDAIIVTYHTKFMHTPKYLMIVIPQPLVVSHL